MPIRAHYCRAGAGARESVIWRSYQGARDTYTLLSLHLGGTAAKFFESAPRSYFSSPVCAYRTARNRMRMELIAQPRYPTATAIPFLIMYRGGGEGQYNIDTCGRSRKNLIAAYRAVSALLTTRGKKGRLTGNNRGEVKKY